MSDALGEIAGVAPRAKSSNTVPYGVGQTSNPALFPTQTEIDKG
jgi:hypothetical protein